MKTVEEKIDDAVHAAMNAMGLSVEGCYELSESINDSLTELATPYLTDDEEDEEDSNG